MQDPLPRHYTPIRPALSARWTEWSALLRPPTEITDIAAPDITTRQAAALAGPVMVLPGLARGDGQTAGLRRFLDKSGFATAGWGLGTDIGPTRRVLEKLSARLIAIVDAGGPANLVGFSMGGLFARWLAQRHPSLVRQFVTVCSPFRSPLESFFLPLRPVAPLWPCDVTAFIQAVEQRPSVPFTCLYTVTDGTVAWQSCVDPEQPQDCFEFAGVHTMMASYPAVWSLLVQRLGRPLS